jgi:predicted HTH domain antitoxin
LPASDDTELQLVTIFYKGYAMSLVIPDYILNAARMSVRELSEEIAVMLFQKEKVTLAQASRLAGMNRLQFQHLLASRQIPIHYDVQDFEKDIKTLRRLGRL